jgi:hypothetical protein
MKSGSTWIVQIVRASGLFAPLDDQFRNKTWVNPSLADEEFTRFFEQQPYLESNVYCKQHWSRQEKYRAVLSYGGVKMLNIIRDAKDVLVSAYFHDKRLGNTESESITDYYWNDRGKMKLLSYMKYQLFWHGDINLAQPHLSCYESLLVNRKDGIRNIFDYLEVDLTSNELLRICKETDFSSNLKTGENTFFRKGQAGDWKNHLNNEIVEDVNNLCFTSGFNELSVRYP